MRRIVAVSVGIIIGLDLLAAGAHAQWYYPWGYGQYGMAGWGGNPQAAYMTGLGSYARGRGVYLHEKAEAHSIDVDTAIKWNKAVRAHNYRLMQDMKKQAAQNEAQRKEQLAERRLEYGDTLNDLLNEIYDVDPAIARAARAKAPISPSAIREIPFEWNSEALTACIDELTGAGSAMPSLLMDAKYAQERNALRAAVDPALEEDARGDVSQQTRQKIHSAVANLRAKFMKNEASYEPGYQEALNYLTTLAAVNRMLNDPSMKQLLSELHEGKERTVGDLITFMNAYNLRFGPARTDRQKEIYARLAPILTSIRDEIEPKRGAGASLDRSSGSNLKSAAQSAFQRMRWEDIDAHSQNQ